MSNIPITQNSKEPKRHICLDMCLCIDKVVTCGYKVKQYFCCLIFLLVILSVTLLIYKCSSIGTDRCLSNIVYTFKGNVTGWT